MSGAGPRILEWYRADQGPRIRRVLLAGPGVLTTGGLVVAVSFLAHAKHDVRVVTAAAGLALIAAGAVFTMTAMYRILRSDVYVAIRTDGLALHAGSASVDEETLIAWDAIAGARWDEAAAAIVLERVEGSPLTIARRFARIPGPELARRLEQARKRAAMGMLR
jgi:hypothetical protein